MIICGINRRILPEQCDPREVHVTRSHVPFVHLLLSVLPRMQPPGFFLSYPELLSCPADVTAPTSEPHPRCLTTAHYLLFIAFLLLGFKMYFYLLFENSIHIYATCSDQSHFPLPPLHPCSFSFVAVP